MKYFLALDKSNKSFGYVVRNYFMKVVSATNNTFTFNKDDDYDEVLTCGCEDYFSYYSHSKPNKKISLLALSSSNDLMISKKDSKIELSPLAFSTYKNVDSLLVFFKEQKEFLENNYDFKNIKYLPICSSITDKEYLGSEINAFRKFYRINNNQKVVISFGNFANKVECKRFEALARTNPKYFFLFFGINNRSFLKTKFLARMVFPNNIKYFDFLDEELYISALKTADYLVLSNELVTNPLVIIDCMKEKMPIISCFSFVYNELINNKNNIMPQNFEELFLSMQNVDMKDKIKNAYKQVINYENNLSISKLISD